GVGAGTPSLTFTVQQTGDEQHGLLAHAERGGVCNTHPAQDPYEVDLWKDHLHTGVLRLYVAPQRLRRVSTGRTVCRLPTVQQPLRGMAQWAVGLLKAYHSGSQSLEHTDAGLRGIRRAALQSHCRSAYTRSPS